MSDERIVAAALKLLGQLQVALGDFEKPFDFPAAVVEFDNLLIGEIDIGREQCQPFFGGTSGVRPTQLTIYSSGSDLWGRWGRS